jgi:hypothetical protein
MISKYVQTINRSTTWTCSTRNIDRNCT